MFYILYGLYGGDDFSLKEALTEIKRGLGDEAMIATNTTVLQGQNITLEELIATCNTIPFLAPTRLVIVEGLLGLFEQRDGGRRSSKLKGSDWSSLKECVKQMPESTVLVLVDSVLKKTNSLLKKLAPQATVREFKPLGGYELQNWMRKRATECGGSMSPSAVRLLTDLVGSNLWILSNEIDKLCLYAMGRTVEENDVRSLVGEAREFSVFDMIDAILDYKSAEAIALLHRLGYEGAAPPQLLYMITRQFRLVIQVKDLLQQRHGTDEIKRTLAISHDFILRKTIKQAGAYPMGRLKGVYRKLLDTDISIKTGRLKGDKGELALELLISELCGESLN